MDLAHACCFDVCPGPGFCQPLSLCRFPGSLEQFSFHLGTTSQVVAGLCPGNAGALVRRESAPQRVVKLDAAGRRYDPTVRGLFED